MRAQIEGYIDPCLALLEMTSEEMSSQRLMIENMALEVGKEKLVTVLAVELHQIRISGFDSAGEVCQYDVFVRCDPSLSHLYPAWMEIKDTAVIEVNGTRLVVTNDVLIPVSLMQESEFDICVKTADISLVPQGVLIVWEWEWQDDDSDMDHVSESSCEDVDHEHHNPGLQTDSEFSSDNEASGFQLPSQTHIVIFKCIGTQHDLHAQETLCEVSTLLAEGN